MLDHWLNDDFVRSVHVNPDEPIRVKVPHAVEGGVSLVEAEMTVPGESYFPITHVADERVGAQWPPRADMPTTVSPEMESTLTLSDARKSLRLRFAWLAPFDELQPFVISPDDLHARDRMRLIAEASGNDCIKARAQALTEAQDWISEGQASLNEVWLMPIISKEGEEGAVIAIAYRFGIEVLHNLEQAYKNKGLRETLNAPTSVTRAWGIPGLMWALLLDRLQAAQPYRTCKGCGKLISGRGHKIYCSEAENPECFQTRRAKDKRRSRARGPTRR